MKKYLFLAAFLLGFLSTGKLFAVNDSCLQLVIDKWDWAPLCDSLRIDTCLNSITYNQYYAKKGYMLFAKVYFFKNAISFDSAYTWEDIDTNFQTIRQAFSDFNNRFCNIKFVRWDYFIENDSEFIDSKHFKLELETYQCVDSVIAFVNKIDGIDHGDLFQLPALECVNEKFLFSDYIISNDENNLKIDFLNFNNLNYRTSVSIYDFMGQLVFETIIQPERIEYLIDTSFLTPGLYFIRIGNSIIKFIIMR